MVEVSGRWALVALAFAAKPAITTLAPMRSSHSLLALAMTVATRIKPAGHWRHKAFSPPAKECRATATRQTTSAVKLEAFILEAFTLALETVASDSSKTPCRTRFGT